MKILLVHPPMPFQGGAEVVLERLRDFLHTHGHQVRYITSCKPRGRLRDLVRLWRETQTEMHDGYDLVNVHNFPATVASYPACRRVPTVWMCNEPPELFTSALRRPLEALNRRLVRRHIHHAVVADRANHDRLRYLYGLDPRVIPYGVDGEYFARDGVPKRSQFTMLQVGTVTPLKNQIASLQLLTSIRKDIPEVRLILAGTADNRYLKQVQAFIRAQGLDGRVTLTGQIGRDAVRELFHSCHVLLHPVLQQGGWLTPFEAIAAGLPVIVWRTFTAAGLVEDEGLGSVVATQHEARCALLETYTAQERARDSAAHAALYVRRELTWDRFCGRMVDYFEEVLAR